MKNSLLEVVVGLFVLLGFGAFVYLALQLGEVPFITQNSSYVIQAEFDDVSGVKKGASVQVAGVVVGDVAGISLNEDDVAVLSLRVDKSLQLPVDSMASVKSQGIIGDKYIALSVGGDDEYLKDGSVITDTESALDIEGLVSKFAFGSAE